MQFKDIMVYIDDGDSNEERINAAISLARSHGARLTGVTMASIHPLHLKVADKKTLKIMCEEEAYKRIEYFSQKTKAEGIESASNVVKGKDSDASKKLAQFARNFDLIMLRQANPKYKNVELVKEIARQVLLLSGRPVFFMPYIGAHRIPCEKAMIAWDGTPAATRAVHDVLPMLECIQQVIILVVQEGKAKTASGELLADDLASHLKRHGVNAEVKRVMAGTFDVPTVILNEIADNDIDLLIMGGYGTPSLKQKLFGGVTRSLLSSMIVPVVMSH